MSDLHSVFIEEATDLFNKLDTALSMLHNSSEDNGAIEQVFRVVHTLKGNSSMFGFQKMGEFAHLLEDMYSRIRNGALIPDKSVLALTEESASLLKAMLEDPELSDKKSFELHQSLVQKISGKMDGTEEEIKTCHPIEHKDDVEKKEAADLPTYYLFFKPQEEIFKSGTNPLNLLKELCALGEYQVLASLDNIPEWDLIEPDKSYVAWHIFMATQADIEYLREVFLFVEDECNVEIQPLTQVNLLNSNNFKAALSSLSFSNYELDREELMKLTDTVSAYSELSEIKDCEEITDTKKADITTLGNIADNLFLAQARLIQIAENTDNPEIFGVAKEIEELTSMLKVEISDIDKFSVESKLARFRQLISELSIELEKP